MPFNCQHTPQKQVYIPHLSLCKQSSHLATPLNADCLIIPDSPLFNLILFFFQNYWGGECCPCRSCSDALVPSFKQVQHSVKFLHIRHYYLLIMFICYPESYSWLGYRLLDKKHSHYIMFGKLRKLSARNKINWKDKKFEINSV